MPLKGEQLEKLYELIKLAEGTATGQTNNDKMPEN